MGLKRDRKIEEKSAWPDLRPLNFSVKRINRNCALRSGCADFCEGAVTICWIQRLWHLFINWNVLLLATHLLGTVQWDWAGVWICAGWRKWLVEKESWMIGWSVVKCRGQKLQLSNWSWRYSERESPVITGCWWPVRSQKVPGWMWRNSRQPSVLYGCTQQPVCARRIIRI